MIWIIILVGAVTSAVIAGNKGRNVLGWCLLGACFPLISIVAIACLPPAERLATTSDPDPYQPADSSALADALQQYRQVSADRSGYHPAPASGKFEIPRDPGAQL
jgi:hypothetical protein